MGSADNLPKDNPSRWKKGQSGNKKGRPKKIFNFLNEVDALFLEVDPNDEQKRTNGRIAAVQFVCQLKQGSIRGWNEYLDRKYGKPPQALAIADLRAGTREEAIAGILESLKAMKESGGQDEEQVIN